jgi:hypothetical protein
MRTLAEHLGTLDADALATVIERRPELGRGPAPRTLEELAQRLEHPESTAAALRGFRRPLLQVVEALLGLDEQASAAAVTELLAGEGPDHDAAVESVLAELGDYAIVWPASEEPSGQLAMPSGAAGQRASGAGRIAVAAGVRVVMPYPLGVPYSARELVRQRSADEIKAMLTAHGVQRPQGRRAEVEDQLVGLLCDRGHLQAMLAAAPPGVIDELRRADDPSDDELFAAYDRERALARAAAQQWASERGLLIGSRFGYDWQLPREVALAVRGDDYRAPFTPRRPAPATHAVAAKTVESVAAAAAGEFAQQSLAVLDSLGRSPISLAKSGGMAVRDAARLAKAAGADDAAVRLALELSLAAGLLDLSATVRVSGEFAAWRDLEPAGRVAALLRRWWESPVTPTESADADGKTIRPLSRRVGGGGPDAARRALIRAVAALPAGRGTTRAGIVEAVLWDRPVLVIPPQDDQEWLATPWWEAERLGVIAAGAVSGLGRALLEDDEDALVEQLGRMLPAVGDRAVFDTDLTAMVAGAPSARVSRLLDAVADRESRGGAVTWRFSSGSVRRALDEGADAEQLARDLAAIATAALPQPLEYLIKDVARRHGSLRVGAAVSLVLGDDEALLAEVAADRRLRKLGLRLVAPTVLSADAPVDEVVAALRKAGHYPMPEGEPDPDESEQVAAAVTRLRPSRRAKPAVDPRALASALLAGSGTAPAPADDTEAVIRGQNKRLDTAEIHQLAHAIDHGDAVLIRYEAGNGAVSRRVISDITLLAGSLFAWCHLRNDERNFTLSRVLSVAPAPE